MLIIYLYFCALIMISHVRKSYKVAVAVGCRPTIYVLFRIEFIMPFGQWLADTALVVHIAASSDQSF
jgi:hypothetical protein